GDRAHDARVLEAVDRARDRRRRSQLGLDDDDVLRGDRAATELGEHPCERVPWIRAPNRLRRDVAGPAEDVARLLEAQLTNVARDGRLRHLAARPIERIE